MFFEEEVNKKILSIYLQKSGIGGIQDPASRERVNRTIVIVNSMLNAPADWDNKCPFNIKHIGHQFVGSLANFDPINQRSIDDAYLMAYRFLCELAFNLEGDKNLTFELSKVQAEITDDGLARSDQFGMHVRYAAYQMPVQMARDIVKDPRLGVLKDAESVVNTSESTIKAWKAELSKNKDEVEQLKSALNTYKHGFNFVGLYQGFSGLHDGKTKEKTAHFKALIALGIAIVIPLVAELTTGLLSVYGKIEFSPLNLLVWIPLASVEIVLIYYFRVVLQNYRSVGAQILQLELRMSLCQFIQSYVEYAEEVGNSGSEALKRFESVVFSNIQADPEKLPNTFDGVEQIASLIRSIRTGA